LSQLVNTIAYRNEETLPYQSLINHDMSNPVDPTKESWCFRNQN